MTRTYIRSSATHTATLYTLNSTRWKLLVVSSQEEMDQFLPPSSADPPRLKLKTYAKLSCKEKVSNMNAHEDFTDYESVLRYCMDKTMGSYDKAIAYGKLQGFFDGNKLTPIGKKIACLIDAGIFTHHRTF